MILFQVRGSLCSSFPLRIDPDSYEAHYPDPRELDHRKPLVVTLPATHG